MHVVYIITRSDAIGGAHVHVRDLCLALQRAGHRATVLVGGAGPYVEELVDRGIEVHSIKNLVRAIRPGDDFLAVLELRKALARLKPDIVSTHSSKAGLLGRIASRSLGIPVLFTAHGWAFTDGIPSRSAAIYRTAERLAAPLADKIITVSEYDRALALRQGVGDERSVVTIHNGMPSLTAPVRDRRDSSTSKIVMTARFEEQKDHGTLLRALSTLVDLDWTVELVGDGPLRPQVEGMAKDFGLADRVAFLGARNDVPEILNAADIFVLISNWEGLPRSILEAMRAGLPVVASAVGGVPELVDDGRTGFLVERQNDRQVASAIRNLLLEPSLRSAMAMQGRERFEACFTFERMFARTMEQYNEVLEQRYIYDSLAVQ